MTTPALSPSWLALKVVPALRGRAYVISIPKRVVPLSTRRSRLKRLIREAVRMHLSKPPEGVSLRFQVKADPPPGIRLDAVEPRVASLLRHSGTLLRQGES